MTTNVTQRSDPTIRATLRHAVLWRAWMLLRAAGRAVGAAAKAGYLGLALVVITTLGIGLLTVTVGGVMADLLVGSGLAPRGASHGSVASVATIALCVGTGAAVAINRMMSRATRPAVALRRSARRGLESLESFRAEWAGAGEAWVDRAARRRRRRRPPPEDGMPFDPEGPIIGHRIWLVGPDDNGRAALIAPVSRLPWDHSIVTASCDVDLARRLIGGGSDHDGPAPALECVCGVYAVKRSMWPAPRHRAPLASGTIALTGRVIEGSRGYRAQQAEIAGPVRIDLVCAGEIEGEVWTKRRYDSWQPVPPNPCPFGAVTLAAGYDEYIGFCRIHAGRVAHLIESVTQLTPLALQAQLELRYGVEVIVKSRAAQWT